jgi:hypothetical protein
MDKRLRPRYYKNKNKVNSKKSKKVKNNKKNKVVNKKSKKIQKGGMSFFGKKKIKTSCTSCIKYGNCSSKMTGRRIGNKEFSSKECKHYSKVWKKMRNEIGLRQGRDDASLIKAIRLYIKKEPSKTLKGFLNEGILSRKLSSQTILNYIKVKNKYEKRKVSLKIAKLLGY